jgi:Dolichyl-phosphate-mannose-protein mannosyltransferase
LGHWYSRWILYLALCVSLQWAGGAFQSGFGANPDEPAHYVTGLMVRDYIAQFFPSSPIAFAKNYYLHYPEVAFGHWPPMFYALEAAWMLLAPVSYRSLLLLMAALTATTALALDRLARGGYLAGVLFIALPITQTYSSSIMAEAPLALFSLLAIIALIRFLEKETLSGALLFGVFASLAILTKPSGWAITIVPAVALLLMRSPGRLLSTRLWISAAMVGVLCVPYYVLTLKMARAGMEGRSITWSRTSQALLEYLQRTPDMVGIVLMVLAACGFLCKVALPLRKRNVTPHWAVIAALFGATLVFHAVVPTTAEPRKNFMALAAIVLFAIAGAEWIAQSKWPSTALIVLAVFASRAFAIAHREPSRFAAAAEYVIARADCQRTVSLVSSPTPGGEGAFIAEIASRERRRPERFVLRASKQLEHSTWNGLDYRPFYTSPEQMRAALDRIPVGLLVMDSGVLRPHEETLRQMLVADAPDWEEIYSVSGITIYRRKKDLTQQPVLVQIDLSDKLP